MRATSLVSAAAIFLGVQALNCSTAALQRALSDDATVLSAETVAANGTYGQGAADLPYPTNPTNLPPLCAVYVNVTTSSTSSFRFGLFLPTEWNERFLAVGNGGFAGGVNWLDMGAGVGYGFAVVSTDTGHNSTSGDLSWGADAPEVLNDWGYRAIHGSVEIGKKLVSAYYDFDAKIFSYYTGCSTGGRQGLKNAQIYPEDFDGILAGAPAWWTTHLQTWTAKLGTYNLPLDSDHRISPALFATIGAEVLKQCDAQDGLADNIISDPLRCNFNPDALLCTPSNANNCLTPPQLETLSKIYSPYVDTNVSFVFPGLALGSEEQWFVLLGTTDGAPLSYGTDYVRYFLNQPDFKWEDFTYATVQLADELDPGNATADAFAAMADYRAAGGKLLHYHGWTDALISTGSSLHFYQEVARALLPQGVPLDDWYRFFLVPGMNHCAGTPAGVDAPWYFAGGNQAGSLGTGVHGVPGFEDAKHDALLALMEWVENGTVVDEIVATKFVDEDPAKGVARQRPMCMYPKQAVYKGEGDVDAAESWECKSLY